MTVTTIKDAWTAANEIFPTDYEQDANRSKRAGYPIYFSTAAGVNAWISDLGNRLEVNLPDGRSVNIWIEAPAQEPEETTEEAGSEANMEERVAVARRVRHLTYFYTEEYVKELDNKKREDAAVKEMQANPSGEIKIMVLTAEQNAKVMMECITDCINAVNILTDKDQDVETWMLAGITAMLDKANELHVIPYDLPTSICGLLCAQFR